MKKPIRFVVAIAIGMLAGAVAGVGFADERSDREALIGEIDALLGTAASELRGAAGSGSGSSEVQAARNRVKQVKDKLSQLERVRGSDEKAISYVARFPRHAEDFDRAAEALGQLKGFKPRGWSGPNPLPAYEKAVSNYYTEMMRENATPASQLGGAAFQALVEASCREDPAKDKRLDRIIFRGDFDFYDRCAKGYECTP